MEGFNYWFIKKTDVSGGIDEIKKRYVTELKEYIEVMKQGLIIKKGEM